MSQNKALDNLKRVFNSKLQDAAANSFYAKIKEVDPDKRTCKVVAEATTYDDVLLYSVENADLKGFVMIPKVDSTVLVDRLGGSNELYVVMFSEVDKVMISVATKPAEAAKAKEQAPPAADNTISMTIDGTGVVFNGGTLGGLVKVGELSTNLGKVTARIDGIIAAIKEGKATAQDGGAGLLASILTKLKEIEKDTSKEDFSNIENTKVKH